MIELGDEVIDTISGFKGIVVSKTQYLTGCSRLCVQPKVDKDGKLPQYETFDEIQLKVTLKNLSTKSKDNDVGGPAKYLPKDR